MAHLGLCLEPGQPRITGIWSHGLGASQVALSQKRASRAGQSLQGEREDGKHPGGSLADRGTFAGLFPGYAPGSGLRAWLGVEASHSCVQSLLCCEPWW